MSVGRREIRSQLEFKLATSGEQGRRRLASQPPKTLLSLEWNIKWLHYNLVEAVICNVYVLLYVLALVPQSFPTVRWLNVFTTAGSILVVLYLPGTPRGVSAERVRLDVILSDPRGRIIGYLGFRYYMDSVVARLLHHRRSG